MKQKGPADAAAAAFVFKTSRPEDRAGDAWQVLNEEVDRSDKEANSVLSPTPSARAYTGGHAQSALRREHHMEAEPFLRALREWNSAKGRRQFLMIVAHGAGSPCKGLSPTDKDATQLVTWSKLESALPNGVDLLFLVGCETIGACQALDPKTGPVRRAIIATTSSKEWGHLIEAFAEMIAMGGNKFTFDDQLATLIADKYDKEAQVRWAVKGAWCPSCPPADTSASMPDLDYEMLREASEIP